MACLEMESVGKTPDNINILQALDRYYTGSSFDFELPYVLRPTGRADCVEKEDCFDNCLVYVTWLVATCVARSTNGAGSS